MRGIEKRIAGLLLGILALSSAVSFAMGAPGDLLWVKTNPSWYDDKALDVVGYTHLIGKPPFAYWVTDIYVVGYVSLRPYGIEKEWRIEKRDGAGDIIWTRTSNPWPGSNVAYGVAVDSTGNLYVVGSDSSWNDIRWRIEKRDGVTGDIIWTKRSNPSRDDDFALDVAVWGDFIYIVGCDRALGDARWRIEKRDAATGNIIWKKTSNPSAYDDWAWGVAVDSTGVYIVGYDFVPGAYDARWRIEKRDAATGSIIWMRTSNPSLGNDEAFGVAVDSTGIYIVGCDRALGDARWRIEKRDAATGSIIWKKTSNPSAYDDEAYDVAASIWDFIYIVGCDRALGDARWRIEKRDAATGNIILLRTSNPSTDSDVATGVTFGFLSFNIYIVGYDWVPGTFPWPSHAEWRIEKREA